MDNEDMLLTTAPLDNNLGENGHFVNIQLIWSHLAILLARKLFTKIGTHIMESVPFGENKWTAGWAETSFFLNTDPAGLMIEFQLR